MQMSTKRKLDPVDVVIVGLGAGGGPAAKVFSEAGYKVVGFEKGPWLRPSEHYSGDALKFQNRSYLWPDKDLMPRTVRRDESEEAEIFNFSPVPSNVGGGTSHMAGWMPRPRECDFIMRSLHGDLEGANLADGRSDTSTSSRTSRRSSGATASLASPARSAALPSGASRTPAAHSRQPASARSSTRAPASSGSTPFRCRCRTSPRATPWAARP